MLGIIFWSAVICYLLFCAIQCKTKRYSICFAFSSGLLLTMFLYPAIKSYSRLNPGEYAVTLDEKVYSCKNIPDYGRICYDDKGVGLLDSESAYQYFFNRK